MGAMAATAAAVVAAVAFDDAMAKGERAELGGMDSLVSVEGGWTDRCVVRWLRRPFLSCSKHLATLVILGTLTRVRGGIYESGSSAV